MSKKLSRNDALDDISAWNTEGVLCLLRKVSEARRDPFAPHFAPFGTSRGARVGATSRRTPTVKGATRPGATSRSTAAWGRERKSETRTCASKAVNTRVFITRLVCRKERIALRKRSTRSLVRIPERFSGDRVKVIDPHRFSFSLAAPPRSSTTRAYNFSPVSRNMDN